jgi:hypothetical protein
MTRDRAYSLLAVAVCVALVAWFWSRGERFIAANGPTFDEPAHLAAGYGYWTAGEFRLNPEHPPLLKLLWSLPLLFADAPPFPREVADATKLNHWHVASAWFFESGASPRHLLDPARRVNLALGCALVLLVGWIGYRVWGTKLAGVAGCAFAASDPTLLALSCVLTTDIGLSLFGLATCYLLWEYAAKPSPGLLIATGVSLGLTLGAKFSAVGLVAGLGLAALVFILRGGVLALPGKAGARGVRPAVELALRLGVIAIITVAATYAFIQFPEWGKGLKFQLTRGDHGDGVMYLNGELSRRGWFHYFLVALALKLPLGLLLAASVSVVSLLASGGREPPADVNQGAHAPRSPRTVFLVVPPLVFFALASYSRVNMGVRVVLPVLPFLYLLAAGLAAPGCCRCARLLVLVPCLAWCGIAAERANPFEIAHFNEIAGGPVRGAKSVADSNLDWGQGLPALKQWMDREGVDAVYLAYFGTDRPEAHGIRFQPLPGYGRVGSPGGEVIPADAPRHVVAVSVNHLLGLFLNEPEAYAWLRDRAPAAVPGGCVYVFDLTGDPESVARIRSLSVR